MNACEIIYNNYLIHHGVKGQKWGVRRFQNPDGSLTEAGKKRYKNYQEELSKSQFMKGVRERRKNASERGEDTELEFEWSGRDLAKTDPVIKDLTQNFAREQKELWTKSLKDILEGRSRSTVMDVGVKTEERRYKFVNSLMKDLVKDTNTDTAELIRQALHSAASEVDVDPEVEGIKEEIFRSSKKRRFRI